MAKTYKYLTVLLLVLTTLLLSACSDDQIKPPADVSTGNAAASESMVAETSAEPATEEALDETPVEAAEATPAAEAVTIAETVLYDAGGIKVTATGYADGWLGPEISVLVENNTEQNLLITTNELSANGYMMPYTSLYAEVAAGKKSNETISLLSSQLEQSGITTIAELQFYIQVQDPDTWDTLALSELISLPTSAYGYEQPIDDSGDVVYESGGIKVVCKGLKQDLIWDGTLVFHMANVSGQPITIYADNVSVNGFMQDVGLWSDLRDQTCLVDGMYLLDLSDLALENIDQVENIEFSLRIINSDTWDEIATTDVISLTFD